MKHLLTLINIFHICVEIDPGVNRSEAIERSRTTIFKLIYDVGFTFRLLQDSI